MRFLICTLALMLLAGCRTQSTAMTNPFLAPDRVPPPATRTLLPGTAQPYYPGDPVPNSPAVNPPPANVVPGAVPTYAPQPAGVVPPGGWNSTPQPPIPGQGASLDARPSSVQQASAALPVTAQPHVQIHPDQQALRFDGVSPTYSPSIPRPVTGSVLPPDASILPTSPTTTLTPTPNQQASFQTQVNPPPVVQQGPPVAEQRAVRIRAISSDNLPGESSTQGVSPSRDGFRPQGSSRVRKPTIVSRLTPQIRQPDAELADRFGHDRQYQWVRGQLGYDSGSGHWSLRYAPHHARIDAFGGILTIANPQVLGDLQPGDFVQLRGRLDQVENVGGGADHVYSVSVVQRQRI